MGRCTGSGTSPPPSAGVPGSPAAELRLGEGLTGGEFRARYEPFDLVAEPDRPICPGGETWHGFGSRVRDTLDGLAAAHRGRTVVAATHAGFASVTEWRHDGGTRRLVRLDDTAHRG
ncbi:histidine phosphatase family protein [Saccharothrix longispora]|uniref:histidine phosphatase family protein n=1 Tax=Saccharothrix longispora TaxID=33920 RepID=UPI0028FD8778|nr:histidine phosphatase family protein [Saccharothrix longispora]MDU0288905.1 histidine phosphatase family protein [Saccharothrix longispora]